MKKQILGLIALVTMVGAFSFAASAQANGDSGTACSQTTIRGNYGYDISGTFFLSPTVPLQLASVGRMTFDGAGNMTGTDTNSFGGLITVNPITGTYQLARDCTGTLTVVFPQGTITTALSVVDNGKEIFTIETLPGTVIRGVMRQQ